MSLYDRLSHILQKDPKIVTRRDGFCKLREVLAALDPKAMDDAEIAYDLLKEVIPVVNGHTCFEFARDLEGRDGLKAHEGTGFWLRAMEGHDVSIAVNETSRPPNIAATNDRLGEREKAGEQALLIFSRSATQKRKEISNQINPFAFLSNPKPSSTKVDERVVGATSKNIASASVAGPPDPHMLTIVLQMKMRALGRLPSQQKLEAQDNKNVVQESCNANEIQTVTNSVLQAQGDRIECQTDIEQSNEQFPPVDPHVFGQALADFDGQAYAGSGETFISFQSKEILAILTGTLKDGWIKGVTAKNPSVKGYFPATFAEEYSATPAPNDKGMPPLPYSQEATVNGNDLHATPAPSDIGHAPCEEIEV